MSEILIDLCPLGEISCVDLVAVFVAFELPCTGLRAFI